MGGWRVRILDIWYAQAPVPWWLAALVPLYRSLRWLHLLPWRQGWRIAPSLPVPVIVVGNLTVGGTGKTPSVIALVEYLRGQGWQPGVVSRGYGAKIRSATLLHAGHTPAEVGDEPCLIRQRSGVPVAVATRRTDAARQLLAQGDVDIIIADDGLQNPSLARDIEICVVDGLRRFGNARLLPAGPLREPLARLGSVDLRICNGGEPGHGEHRMQLQAEHARRLGDDGQMVPLAQFTGQRVHAVAGIGNPQRFFDMLRSHGLDPVEHAYDDHHGFSVDDFIFAESLPVLMTEKDAVKAVRLDLADAWYVPVTAQLPAAFFAALDQQLATLHD